MSLEEYLQRFRRLHTDRGAGRWPEATRHRAPHKPLLLLAVLELIEEGVIAGNRIELSPELAEAFARYWAGVPSGKERGKIVYPFFHLRSEKFWHLVPQPGQEAVLQATGQISSPGQLNRLVQYVRLDESLFLLLTVRESRQQLREVLIQTYFDSATQKRLVELTLVNLQAFQYSLDLLAGTASDRVQEQPPNIEYLPAVRDQGFRRAVVRAYDRRCALCGIRILTLEGHTAVEAAHIIPWSVSHNDCPNNGLALCRLCHWAFDEGMLGVNERYVVLTSPQLGAGTNRPAHLGALDGREMVRPAEPQHLPNQDSLAWHRKQVFRPR